MSDVDRFPLTGGPDDGKTCSLPPNGADAIVLPPHPGGTPAIYKFDTDHWEFMGTMTFADGVDG